MARHQRALDVLVIGAGPVGLTVAQLLGRAGISTLVVERHPGTSEHPRASGIHARTMELFRRWGIADDVRRVAVPEQQAQGFVWMTRLNGLELGRLLFSDGGMPASPHAISPERPCFCPQLAYEPVLLSAVQLHPTARVEFDTEVVSIRQDDRRALVGCRRGGRESLDEVEASFVVAADGASSPTRERLGVGETGTPRFGHSVNVYFQADLTRYVRDMPFMLFWIVNGDTQGTIGASSPTRTRWTYNFEGEPDREYSGEEVLRQVRLAVGEPDLEAEVLQVLRWDYDQAVTDRWRVGRVLFAGDAAHRFPPHGAFGMNSGVQDANNLAWKLIHVLRRRAGDALLDTYEAERRAVAQSNSELALANTRGLADAGWHSGRGEELACIELPVEGRAVRDRIAAAVSKQRAHLHSEGQQFGTIYESGAVVADGSRPVGSSVSEYHETGHPGARAPHVWLRGPAGQRLSTLDIGGLGFVLLAGSDGDSWLAPAAAASEHFGIELTARQIGGRSEISADGRDWETIYGISGDGAVLIRPDGHVGARFAHAPESPATAITDALSKILSMPVAAGSRTKSGEIH